MKIIPNFINYNLAKYYTFIIIIQIIIKSLHANKCDNCKVSDYKTCIKFPEGEQDECSCTNPKPHIDGNCYSCEGNYNYYSILNNGQCIEKNITDCLNKIINETNECVGHCPSDACELYNYCYNNINEEIVEIISSTPYKTCKCKFKKQKVEIENSDIEVYICSNEDYICPSGYYNYDIRECVSGCGSNRVLIKWGSNGEILERRCSSKCLDREYIYEKNNSCLESCLNYKYTRNDGSLECLDECNNGDFYSSDNECVSECSGNDKFIVYDKINNDKNELVKQCVAINDNNKRDYYEYNGIYIKSCYYTQQLFNIRTYAYTYNNEDSSRDSKGTCNEFCSTLNNNDKTYYIRNDSCVENCDEDYPFFYNNECLQSCDTGEEHKHDYKMNFSIIDNNEVIIEAFEVYNEDHKYPDKTQCLKECPIGTFKDGNTCYISSCINGNLIDSSSLECKELCVGKIYKETVNIKSFQIPTTNGGRLLEPEEAQNTKEITRKYCVNSCPVSAPYYNFNKGNECYKESCKSRGNYSAYDKPYICYDSCDSIPDGEYKYENDFICYKASNAITCNNYFYEDKGITQCATLQECIDKKFSYIKEKECVKECNNFKIEKILNNEGVIQNIGKCFSEAKECINVNYIFINADKICDTKCDGYKTSETNPIANENGETCFNDCPDNYPYKDTVKKLCLMNCEKFFYGDECIDNCKDNGTYHFQGSYECLKECKIGNEFYYIRKDDPDNLCYNACPEGYPYIEYPNGSNKPYMCVDKCGGDNQFYYEDEKKCVNKCDIHNSLATNDKVCVNQCPQDQVVVQTNNEYYCNSTCPIGESFILNTTIEISGKKLIVEKCVEACKGVYNLISSTTNHCLKECTFSESYEYNGYCYEKCPNNTFPNDIEKKCYNESNDICTGDFKYYEKDEYGNYRCKKTCYPSKYSLPEGGKCLDECPDGYDYITYNKLCLKSCNKTYGEYFRAIDNNEHKYECASLCGENELLLLDKKKCIRDDQCPEDYYKIDNICSRNCSFDDNKPFAITATGKKECAIKCDEDSPNYGDDKICKNGCNESIIDWDKKCVTQCTHSYYRYIQDGKCVNECDETNFYFDGKCVNKCPSSHNYIEGKECKKKCEEYPNVKENETVEEGDNKYTLYECVENCGDLYYYESGSIYNQKKCFSQCNGDDFIIVDTHICTSVCPSTHKSYFTDKDEDPVYKNNTCVLKCPSNKPFIYLGKCLNECPTLYKYHIEGEFNCINDCPTGTYADNKDQFTCKSYCPNDKFLDNNEKDCIEKCESPYKFYIKGINKCISGCGDGDRYHIENDTVCVEHCSDGYYLFDNNTCINKCPADENYFVYTDDNKIKCVKNCPSGYSFYENKGDVNYCKIKCDNVYDPNGNCLTQCEDPYKYYNYKNMACLSECPKYQEKISDSLYKCYDECPSNKPFIKDKECVGSCGGEFINLENNKCLGSCDVNQFSYGESEGKKYCLNKCDDLGLFQKGEKECVKNCGDDGLIPNMATKKCECEKYFSIEDGKIKCLKAEEIGNGYILYGTYQYLENCTNYPFYDDNTCYSSEDQLPLNINKDNRKIKCINKYYIEGSTKICLEKKDPCPLTFKYLIPDTRQCVNECPGDLTQKGNYCLTNCGNNFYFTDSNEENYICTDNNECPSEYPYLIEDLKQCVKDCSETDYYIFYDNKCYSTCNSFSNTIAKKVTRIINNQEKIIYECSCTSDLWYKDGNNVICNLEGKSSCKELTSNQKELLVKDTKECVNQCPNDYSYKFNDECFYKCDDVKKYYDYEIEAEESPEKICKCKYLWKYDDNNKIICIGGNVCNEDENKLLLFDTKKCVGQCPTEYNIQFNNTCYINECPEGTKKYTINDKETCICENKWYKYEDKSLKISDIIKCLDVSTECPKDFYPYMDNETKECLENISKCGAKKIFNNICYEECPLNTKEKDGSQDCECDKEKGFWYKSAKEDKIIYVCGLNECLGGRSYIDYDTNECLYECGNKYHFLKETQDYCYSTCPENTVLVDKISKECVEIINFDNPSDLKTLDEKVIDNIKEIYPKTSKGGLVYNVNNSTLQIYGVNKNKTEKQDLIMRNNLTYIDLGNCIDKIYEKNSLSEDTDIIIVKYDIASSNSLIKPVEYKIINSKTGDEIPLDACEDNSIVISYPLSDILKNFATETNPRNLEESRDNNNLNLREKFLKGKELNLEDNKIDSFNYNNKLYTDICYPLKLNGKDVILEDRFNYLYPLFSFCESNCLYDRTDFTTERVYCNCSPKDGVNFERNFELLDTKANINDVKKKQKGSILKCLGKISDTGKNFGFWYGFIILLVEIAMVLLTIFYSYKVYIMRIKKKIDLDVNKTNNIDTENIESMNLSEAKRGKNNNEEIIKTSERNLESQNPPKRKNSKLMTNIEEDDKKRDNLKKRNPQGEKSNEIEGPEVINIKTTKKNNRELKEEKISSANSYNLYFGKSSENISIKEMDDDDNIFDLIILEQKKLTIDYDLALKTNRAEILIMIITEILDKIYLIKAIWFLTKYELFSIYFSLYLLWHILIVSFLSLFYNNSTLHKIWIKDNYPNLTFHLSFGFLSCIISFIIYKGLYILVNNEKKIKEIESIAKENKDEINAKYKNMMFWHQIKLIIFYAIEFIFVFLFFLYLTAFCGVYANAKAKLVESYGIALIEVVIIKILYGLVLGILRKVSLAYKINILYRIVQFLDLYIA